MLVAWCLVAALTPPAQDAALPNPWTLKRAERESGNPLAEYVEMLRLEGEFRKDEMRWRSYSESRATTEGNLGEILASLRTQDATGFPQLAKRPLVKSPLHGLRRIDAVDYLVQAAQSRKAIILGEEHMKPQTRTLIVPLLRGLRRKGYRYFAAETFSNDLSATVRRGYPGYDTGTYTRDPIFGEAVREAIKLGFTLIPYEAGPSPNPIKDPLERSQYRETKQAENLKARLFDRDPSAKAFVWCGRTHASKTGGKFPDGRELKTMAHELRRLTGIDPLTAYLPFAVEGSASEFERADFKLATHQRLVPRPSVFVGPNGNAYNGETEYDATVFFPRTTLIHGRPDWLVRDLGRRAVEIRPSLVDRDGMMLAQAFYENEPVTAIPIDQILIRPGEPVPALMLPRRGRFWYRIIDAEGRENGRATVSR